MKIKSSNASIIWLLEGDSIHKSYLMGTIHIRDNIAFEKLSLLMELIGECQIFAAEFNLDDMNPVKFQEASRLNPSDIYSKKMNPRIYQKLDNITRRILNCPLHVFEQKMPLMLQDYLTHALLNKDQSKTLDATLFELAKNYGLELTGLESFENQIETLRSIPLKDQFRMLKKITLNFPKFRKEILLLTEMYKNQNLSGLYNRSKRSIGSLRKLLLFDRNVQMCQSIINLAQGKRLFTAVGAAHLAGEKGLIRLLKKKDIRVKPIKF